MNKSFITSKLLKEFKPFESKRHKKELFCFDLEITARCNNNCRHCYINLPADDRNAQKKELSFKEIEKIAEELHSLKALWCLITGGEPLLRNDFPEIYICLKKMGFLVSIFTNATMVTKEHVKLFKSYPPREIEVSVYGITKNTYENVTRRPGSFKSFMKGLNLLLEGGLKINLKTIALRSNRYELSDIARFCREKSYESFRFDPFLHLRFDGNPIRNEEIKAERLSPDEIIALEQSDSMRFNALKKLCNSQNSPATYCEHNGQLFFCHVGIHACVISYDGFFRPCATLVHPDCIVNLKQENLSNIRTIFIPAVRNMRSNNSEYLEKCYACQLKHICMFCPAYAYLETGRLDGHAEYFCKTAHLRYNILKNS